MLLNSPQVRERIHKSLKLYVFRKYFVSISFFWFPVFPALLSQKIGRAI